MSWQVAPYVPGFLVGAAAALAAGLLVFEKRDRPGGWALTLVLFGAAAWTGLAALEHSRTDLASKLLLARLEYVAIAFIPVAWAAFAARFTGRLERVSPRLLAALCVVPSLSVTAALVSPAVPLFWRTVGTETVDGLVMLNNTFGPMFAVHTAYSYLLLAAGTVLLARTAVTTTGLHREQGMVVAAAAVTPWAGNAVYLAGLAPFDPTPLGFVVSGLLLAGAVLEYDLLDVLPAAREVGRDTAVEQMADGVVVADDRGVVTDCNEAAARAFGCSRGELLGEPLAESMPQLAAILENGERSAAETDTDVPCEDRAEIRIDPAGPDDEAGPSVALDAEGDEPPGRDPDVAAAAAVDADDSTARIDRAGRHYDVRVSRFRRGPGLSGTVLTLRDVTDSRRRSRRMSVLNRVLRHDLRNEMNVVLGYAELLEHEAELSYRGGAGSGAGTANAETDGSGTRNPASLISERANVMLDISEKVREVEATIDAGERATLDVAALLRSQVDSFRRQHPNVDVGFEAPESAVVSANELVDSVFSNLLENAVEHSHRERPSLEVTVTPDEEYVLVTVSDDGPGIPGQELAAFRGGETQLVHSSGFGLWLVVWLVEESDGDVTFDVDETGTTVQVRLPRVESGD